MAKKVNSSEFKSEVLDHKGVVLVDFFATWCGPCKALTPIVDKLSEEMNGKVKIVKVDIDENSALATEYRVMSVPTMKLFKDGEVVETLVGLRPESELRDKLNYYSAE
ncbi:thioredoxin [Eubacterium sp.]|uniref:thioredoxin n=1 Tax=Eubacterium sp. TaxID=142586 RepID=UPI0026DFF6D5|nr:thioredoxin [Eubacterium sp.]MDO5432931.1 thioredoxin [Eubacterium sp.]